MFPRRIRNLRSTLTYFSARFNSSKKPIDSKSIQYYKMSHSTESSLADQQNDIYFGSEVVNRVSFLREDDEFLKNSATHPSTRFFFFKKNNPLFYKGNEPKLVSLTNGDNPYDPHNLVLTKKGLNAHELWSTTISEWAEANRNQDPGLRDQGNPVLLFMGIEDESVGLDLQKLRSSESSEHEDEKYLDHQGRYQGIPHYAVDLTNAPQLEKLVLGHIKAVTDIEDDVLFFTHSRKHYLSFSNREAALYSHAKMFLDWIDKNRFCPGCGSKVIPINGGGKLKCTNLAKSSEELSECPVQQVAVSNVSFPRTDAVIITAITNTDHTKILLSLSKRFAQSKLYACTAGFMEPSETVEVATKREIWEETGVVCSKISVLRTQPWPFPGNLMIGCLGIVEFNGVNESIHLGHDRELADARWFDIEFVRALMYKPHSDELNSEGIMLPSPESIAFSLIKHVVDEAPKGTKL